MAIEGTLTERIYHKYWGWPLEKQFIDGLGDHAPNLVSDKTRAQWIEAYIRANSLPNLVEQPWREEALCYAQKLLGHELRQGKVD